MPPTQSSSSEASSFIIRRRVRRRNSSTNTIMTMGNRSKLLVAGSMIIGALFWTVSRAVGRGGEVPVDRATLSSHLRGRAGSFMTDAAVDDRASSSRIHPHTQPFVSHFENLCSTFVYYSDMKWYNMLTNTHALSLLSFFSPPIYFDRTCCTL